ncbi:MAG: hypothetical protein HY370_05965 [Proteobacteria bacterium]|nr:hypothetical protein [Pseudomonadota bacterium]
MAYIGDDDPHRRDSKAATGLAKITAEILNGRHIYVDERMLETAFPGMRSTKERLHAYLRQCGNPDIVIGTHARHAPWSEEHRPAVIVSSINESLSDIFGLADRDLVPHHLTQNPLEKERQEFLRRYPRINNPLVAVMMGEGFFLAIMKKDPERSERSSLALPTPIPRSPSLYAPAAAQETQILTLSGI